MPPGPGMAVLPLPATAAPRPAREVSACPARAWVFFAVGSLLVSGLFALLLVAGRVPPFSSWITDPDFFRRCLVVHVNLSLLVWFCAMTAVLYSLVPGPRQPVLQRTGLLVAIAGAAALLRFRSGQ